MVESKTARVLDANLNRAREGIRVAEDTARFIWGDAGLYKRLRKIRHTLDSLTRGQYEIFLKSRDSVFDQGREIKEEKRSSKSDVATANLKRAQEALRVLEEYGKLFSAKAGGELKKLRFDLYTLEKNFLKYL